MFAEAGPPVEIVAVGRELLTGRTTDTNSAWIATQLTQLGAQVQRIVAVDDDPAAIAREIAAARARGARLVTTTGGLGPTLDDRTLTGVAMGLGREVVEQPAAVAFVAHRYAELASAGAVDDATLTPPRRKMACLPAGAEPIENPVGTAPGVYVADGEFALFALPGVPSEMQAVFEAAADRIRAHLGAAAARAEREVASGCGDESVITLAVERVMADVPGVYLKSLPTAFAPGCDLRVRITARGQDSTEAEGRLARASQGLADALTRLRTRT
jgi:molybdenum cofactor synthesis domain-containing protein